MSFIKLNAWQSRILRLIIVDCDFSDVDAMYFIVYVRLFRVEYYRGLNVKFDFSDHLKC